MSDSIQRDARSGKKGSVDIAFFDVSEMSGIMQLLYICLKAPNCEAFDTWGFTDKYSSMSAPQNPLPFDSDFNKKESYNQMLTILQNYNKSSSSAQYKLEHGNGEALNSQKVESQQFLF